MEPTVKEYRKVINHYMIVIYQNEGYQNLLNKIDEGAP